MVPTFVWNNLKLDQTAAAKYYDIKKTITMKINVKNLKFHKINNRIIAL